jgi:glucose/arabinose dehydrogenase
MTQPSKDTPAESDGAAERSDESGWLSSTAISRRRLLAATAIGAAGVAGCAATEPNDSTDADGGDGDDGGSDGSDGGDGDDGGSDGSDGSGDGGTGTDAEPVIGRPLASWSGYDPEWESPTTSPLEAEFETEVLVENLEIPWDLSFAADGTLFITERVGRVLRFDGENVSTVAEPENAIDAGAIDPAPAERKWWVKGGEGGTLGVAAHPTFPDPPHIYVYYTTGGDDGKTNRVDAFDVTADDPGTAHHTVVEGIPADNYHNGGRITFGPRNYLWVTCGDGGNRQSPQDLSSYGGKILRVTPEGEPAPDNPDLGDDADPRVFTYGHRNPQGIVWLPDGTPVNSEHGQNGRDELNRLEAGSNYGWSTEGDTVRDRDAYVGSDVHKPLFNTGPSPSIAPSGSVFYTGDSVPALRNRIVTGALISQQLLVTTLTPPGGDRPPAENAYGQTTPDTEWADEAYSATVHTLFEDELGRIRHAEQSPDGDLYLCTSNRDGRSSEAFPREIDDVLVRVTQA